MPGPVATGSSPAIWYAVPTGAGQDGNVVSTANLIVPQPLACITEGIGTVSSSCAAQDSCSPSFELLTQLLSSPRRSRSATLCFTGNDTSQPNSILQPKSTAGNTESSWDHDDTQLGDVPTCINSSGTQQSLAVGTPRSRRSAALPCPPAPVRPRPSMILVPAEELHMYTCKKYPPAFCGTIRSRCM